MSNYWANNEDAMLRQGHPMYDAFCREDEYEDDDLWGRGGDEWEAYDGR